LKPLKIFVISGGAAFSLKDVDTGVVAGLRAAGAEVGLYAYDERLGAYKQVLEWMWKKRRKDNPAIEKPPFLHVQLNAISEAQMIAQLNDADFVLFISGMFVPLPVMKAWRRYSRIPIALLLTESPYDLENEVRWVEQAHLAWTNERSVVDRLRQVNPQVRYLPHAWLPGVHDVVPEDMSAIAAHDVVFVGTSFKERIAFLEAIDWTGIDFGIYGHWKSLPRKSRLQQYIRGGVQENATTSALYRRAKVGLNLYRHMKGWTGVERIAQADSLNLRAYELATAGCFQVSDHRAEIAEIFGDAVATFTSPAECEAAICHALADDVWRRRCVDAAKLRAQGHTWYTRGIQMMADLQRYQHQEAAA
jgi:spore maturation protein CgeB